MKARVVTKPIRSTLCSRFYWIPGTGKAVRDSHSSILDDSPDNQHTRPEQFDESMKITH